MADELRSIQASHCIVRDMETLVGSEAEESLHLQIGSWQVAWMMGRTGATNLVELCYWAMTVEHQDDDGVLALLDLLEAFPSLRRAGMWSFYEEIGAPKGFILFRRGAS